MEQPGTPEDLPLPACAAPRSRRWPGFQFSPLVWLVLGSLLLTVLVSAFDTALTAWLQGAAAEGTAYRRMLKLPWHLFRWWTFIVLAGVLFGYPQRRRLLIGFAVTVASCIGCLWILKFSVGRARPDTDLGPLFFDPFGGFDSFPSGHATQAVLLTALLGLYFPWLRWPLGVLTVLVCLGRIALERHFASDVAGGATLALLAVYLSVRLLGPESFPRLRVSDFGRRGSSSA